MASLSGRRQARVVFEYVRGFLRGVPMLDRMIESETKEQIHLSSRRRGLRRRAPQLPRNTGSWRPPAAGLGASR